MVRKYLTKDWVKEQLQAKGKVRLRSKGLSDGTVSIYLDCYDNGKRSYEFIGLRLLGEDRLADVETIRLAHEKRTQRETELRIKGTGVIPSHIRKASFLDWFRELATKKGHPAWDGAHRHLMIHTGGKLTFGEVTKDFAESFREYLLCTSELSRNSCALYWQKFCAAIRKAIIDEKLVGNPVANVDKISMESTERVHLTIEEVRKLAETTCQDEAVKAAFLFSCFTGLRRSDLYNLTWESVQGDRLKLRIKKTRQYETFPLTPTAIKLLGEPGTPSAKVFDLPPQRTADNILMRWATLSKIGKEISWHTARHTYAMMLLDKGVDLFATSKLLGHRSLRSTQVYARILDKQKDEAVAKLPTL